VQTNLQILCNVLDFGMDPAEASAAPRFLIGDQEEFGNNPTVRVESRVATDTPAQLQDRGHDVHSVAPWALGGGVQLIARDPETGLYRGATDIRRSSNSILGI
jgi:gamma-glutamyltranspeptidase/glutathione hydrolase